MSTNRWVASVAMLCPAQFRALAAATAASLSGNPEDNDPRFCSREVGLKDSSEVSYYLAHSRIREKVLIALPALPVQFPGALYILTSHDDYPESVYLTVDEWMDSLGLEFKDIDLSEVLEE